MNLVQTVQTDVTVLLTVQERGNLMGVLTSGQMGWTDYKLARSLKEKIGLEPEEVEKAELINDGRGGIGNNFSAERSFSRVEVDLLVRLLTARHQQMQVQPAPGSDWEIMFSTFEKFGVGA